MGRLSAQGKYIYEDGRKFFACGVSYGPFAPNSRGESYPEPHRVAADFALMRELGANLVRTYVVPPPWLFEQAAKHGLRLMVGIPWPFHLTFLDSQEMTREIRNTMRREIAALRQYGESIFAYSLGNEIRADIVRWHGPRAVSRFLAELYDIGKQLDPEAMFTYSNYPSVEYLDLGFLDVASFNVYLHDENDFRRYLTHLMAATGDRPLVLSETGMDTIREGEQHQAELLGWQSRAAFELGLSGMVTFAFTDEWFTGGREITDWAFGITTRERMPKPAFAAVGAVFREMLPPALKAAPRTSVIVPAYNAAASIGRCLESLKRLNYPDYEVIVVDDGSTDSTAAIAEAADVRTLKLAHRGLGAARNAGLEAAAGRIVAFIDADAEADRDWLYHLGEAITRREAAAVGGQNFSPVRTSAMARAIAAAPGQPREVRAGDQDLAQLCGCSMALDKNRLEPDEAFDPAFASAGDDVDLSWRLRDAGLTLAYAPGAVVIHERRATLRAYLKQQRGYGHAEGLLYRKYPRRGASGEGIYAGSGWLAQWFGAGQRIYYGAFGRGLFQTVYPGAPLPMAAQLPLTIEWVAIAAVLALAGVFDPAFGALGIAGLVITVLCACAGAALTPRRELAGVSSRVMLALLWLLGPLVRSWERQRVKWSFKPEADGGAAASTALHGTLAVPGLVPTPREAATRGSADLPDIDAMTSVMHLTLVRRGLAVVKGTTYDPFDLQIETVPLIHVPMVFLSNGGSVSLGWRTGIAQWRAAAIAAALFILLMIGGIPVIGAIMIVVLTAIVGAGVAWSRARRIPAVISAALTEVAPKLATLDPRAVSSTTEAAD